jgi:hypothetical protein
MMMALHDVSNHVCGILKLQLSGAEYCKLEEDVYICTSEGENSRALNYQFYYDPVPPPEH